jgi:hypothetical protein
MLPITRNLVLKTFGFQRRPEASHGGVIVTIAFGAHTRIDAMAFQQAPEIARSLLHPAIGMMDLGRNLPKFYRAVEGSSDQFAFQRITQFPAGTAFGI